MSMYCEVDHLAHYGVKGMRWGIRKDPKTGGRKLGKTEKKILRSNVAQKVGKAINKSNSKRAAKRSARKRLDRKYGAALKSAKTSKERISIAQQYGREFESMTVGELKKRRA